MMKKILLTLAIAFGLTQITKAQVVTCLPCDQLSMTVNVSDTNYLNIYHAGQYLTHPQEFNVFAWEFTDQQGNIIFEDTIVDDAIVSFSHSFPISDTMNVTVYLRNDSANLDNWYISEGLPTTGNSINCLFEDQIYWETGAPTPWGSWTFIHNNPGVDQNIQTVINDYSINNKSLIKVVDVLGRENSGDKNKPLFFKIIPSSPYNLSPKIG